MRRRGRAQDSTEGPDGPRLGYGVSQEVMAHGLDGSTGTLWDGTRYVLRVIPGDWVTQGWLGNEMRVRSGRERLGE